MKARLNEVAHLFVAFSTDLPTYFVFTQHEEGKVEVGLVPHDFPCRYVLGFGFRSYPKVCSCFK